MGSEFFIQNRMKMTYFTLMIFLFVYILYKYNETKDIKIYIPSNEGRRFLFHFIYFNYLRREKKTGKFYNFVLIE